jgi:hypothetical protein
MPKESNDYDLDDHKQSIEDQEHELNAPDEPCLDDDPIKLIQ